MLAIHTVSCDAKCFKLTLCLFLSPNGKLPFGSLLYVKNDLTAMLLAPGYNRAAFLVPVPWTVHNIYVMGNR